MKFIIILLIFTSLLTAQFKEIEKTNISGRSYYLSMPPAFLQGTKPDDSINLLIFSKTEQKITISSEDGYFREIKATPNKLTEVNLTPGVAQPIVYTTGDLDRYISKVYEGRALKVEGSEMFQLNATLRYYATSDGTMILPINKLGKEYILTPYTSRPYSGISLPNLVTVVAIADNTKIDFTLGGNELTQVPIDDGTILNPGDSYSWTINKGDVLTLTNSSKNETLSGSHLKANKPINVISGHYCADIPVRNPACDYNIAQDYPIQDWGRNFLIPTIKDRKYPNIIRIFAKEENTKIYRNGEEIAVLNGSPGGIEGEGWIELRTYPNFLGNNKIAHISADKPISISMYNPGGFEDESEDTDPFQVNLAPVENLTNNLYFSTPASGDGTSFDNNYLSIFIEADEDGEVPKSAMWGSNSTNEGFDYIPFSEILDSLETITIEYEGEQKSFLYTIVELPTEGSFNLKADVPVSVVSYGNAFYNSYGYDNSVGIGTVYDDFPNFVRLDQEVFKRNDSIILTGEIFYKNSIVNGLELNNEIDPFSFSGYKNNIVIDYLGEYYIQDPSEDQVFNFDIVSEGNELFKDSFNYTSPIIGVYYQGSLTENLIELGDNRSKEESFDVLMIDNMINFEIENINISSSYFRIDSYNKLGNNPVAYEINLARIEDFGTIINDTISIDYGFGIKHEFVVTGTYSNSGFTNGEGQSGSIYPKQEFVAEHIIKASCELPANESTIITELDFDATDGLNIAHNLSLPFEIKANEEQTVSLTFSASEPGNYEASVSYENTADEDCSTETIFNIEILDPSSVNNLPSDYLRISPNPTDGKIRLQLEDDISGLIRIYDLNGNELIADKINGSIKELNVSVLPKGKYFIEISNTENKIIKQFIKK